MAEKELQTIIHHLQKTLSSHDYTQSPALLSRAKLALLSLNALTPTASTPSHHLTLARQTLELGALTSIRLQDPDAFTRYYTQLQPFYELEQQPTSANGSHPHHHGHHHQQHHHGETASQQSKITGLYLLLLLTKGDYAGFHTCLESLMISGSGAREGSGQKGVEHDVFISYPVKLEQWLMEGAYDRVWGATKSEGAPSEEFGVFSGILIHTIRSEIASCSEKAYPSLPISNAKNLLFLSSEGEVVEFAQSRGWVVKDGRIRFTDGGAEALEAEQLRKGSEILAASGTVIENTIGYARELETIV